MASIASSTVAEVQHLIQTIKVTSLRMELPKEDEECRCAIHQRTVVGAPQDGGCAGESPGSMPAIRAMYRYGGGKECHAEFGVRVLDAKCAALAATPSLHLAAYAGGAYQPIWKYVKGKPKALTFFGAGYCYLALFIDSARVRVARVLGPCPYVIDVLRMMRVLGRAEVLVGSVRVTPGGNYHWNVEGDEFMPGWCAAKALVDVLGREKEAKIGGDPAGQESRVAGQSRDLLVSNVGYGRANVDVVVPFHACFGLSGASFRVMPPVSWGGMVTPVVEWLAGRGWRAPNTALFDLALIVAHPSQQAVMLAGGRARVKVLAMVGDSCLRTMACLSGLSEGGSPEECARKLVVVENASLADIARDIGFDKVAFGGANVSAKVMADSMEALLGIIVVHSGFKAMHEVYVDGLFTFSHGV